MALGDYTNFVVREEEFDAGYIETLGQNVALFNEASRNCLRLVSMEEQGHYTETRFFDLPTGIITRRDLTSASAITPDEITQDEVVSVKLNRKFYLAHTLDSWRKIGLGTDDFSFRLGQVVAEQVLQNQLSAAVNALEAALSQESGLAYDYSGTGDITHAAMISTLAQFGDQANRIRFWLMHSKPFFDLMAANVTVASGNVAGMTLIDAQVASLNRPIGVTDETYLIAGTSPTDYATIGLVENAVVVTETERPIVWTQQLTGYENMRFAIQGEFAFNVEIKGYAYDKANGGINPTDATLGTSTNWDEVVARDKDKAGVYLRTT